MGQVAPVCEYVFEQNRYSKEEIKEKFQFDNYNEVVIFIKKLKQYGILKMVKNTSKERELSDLADDEIEIVDVDTDTEGYLYIFTFVGVLAVGDRIIKCLPKYLKRNCNKLDVMKQVVKVIERYNLKKQVISFSESENNNGKFNLISIMLYLLNDYYRNGLYYNEKNIVETNGEGEILWDNTINDTFAIISNNKPYYLELKTKNIVSDDEDYFRRLQRCIITECSDKLDKLQMLDLFDMDKLELSDEDLSQFGDEEYIAYRIEKEKSVQYITQKQEILQAMYAYITHRASFENDDNIILYGTNSFNLVWENVCAEVFNNKLNDKISSIVSESEQSIKDNTLISIIEKPEWIYTADGGEHGHEAKDTLRPDLISIYSKDNRKVFGIFDAKYYNIIFNANTIKSQPGIQDVTKQYLYQLAYSNFISKYNFDAVNAFLIPSDSEEALLLGKVKMNMFKNLYKQDLKDILVIKLPAHRMYEYYINCKKIDINNEFDFL